MPSSSRVLPSSLVRLTTLFAIVGFVGSAHAVPQQTVVDADYFALNQVNWNGTSHQQGGTARVGGYMRNPLTAFDFEALARFDLRAVQGNVQRARLKFRVNGGQSFGPQTVQLFEQDILQSFNAATVSYSTFTSGPFTSKGWSHLLGQAGVNSASPGSVQIESAELLALVKRWVKQPATNAGVVLTGTFWYWDSYINVSDIELEVEVDGSGWVLVGEQNILNFSPGGPHDFALAPDGTPYVSVRHVGPQACPMCPPPLEPHVARFNGAAWQDLNPSAFVASGFVGIAVRSDNVPLSVEHNAAWFLSGSAWQSMPAIPAQYSHPFTLPELVTGAGNTAFLAARSASGSSVLRLTATGWQAVGGGVLPVADVFSGPALTVTAAGLPVVAVRAPNSGTTANIFVYQFNGSAWQQIGPIIHAERVVTPVALTVTPSGKPFVAFSTSFTTQSALSLLTFDGTNWVGTGPVNVPGVAFQGATALASSPTTGEVYAIASLFDSATRLEGRTVVRWTGSAWQPLSANGYRTGNESPGIETKLAISSAGVPYVAYQNETGGISVKKFVQ